MLAFEQCFYRIDYIIIDIVQDIGQRKNNVIFDFGSGNTLTLVGVDISDLNADDFVGVNSAEPLDNLDAYAGEPLSGPNAFAADIVDVFDTDALI
jgi:hypothetical protein